MGPYTPGLPNIQRIKIHCVVSMDIVVFLSCCAKQDHIAFDYSIACKKKDQHLYLFCLLNIRTLGRNIMKSGNSNKQRLFKDLQFHFIKETYDFIKNKFMSIANYYDLIAAFCVKQFEFLSRRKISLLCLIETSSLSKHYLSLSKYKITYILSPSEFLFVLS